MFCAQRVSLPADSLLERVGNFRNHIFKTGSESKLQACKFCEPIRITQNTLHFENFPAIFPVVGYSDAEPGSLMTASTTIFLSIPKFVSDAR